MRKSPEEKRADKVISANVIGEYEGLIDRAFHEFGYIGDYIWKSPRIIESEKIREQKVLESLSSTTAVIRAEHEYHILDNIFPYMIANGNIYSAISMYETYLLMLMKTCEMHNEIKLDEVKGYGVSKYYKYLDSLSISYKDIELFSQVEAAIEIRNCLMHCSGHLQWNRNKNKINEIVKLKSFLSVDHVERRIESGSIFDEVMIEESEIGKRLMINNNYSFIVCFYLRDYFTELVTRCYNKYLSKTIGVHVEYENKYKMLPNSR